MRTNLPNCKSGVLSSYGLLLEDSDGTIDADGVVHKWVVRASVGAVVYAVWMVLFAATVVLHVKATGSAPSSFALDALNTLAMAVCKLMVGVSAHMVHRHLSLLSRTVVAYWVLVLAASKVIIAICIFLSACLYLVIAIVGLPTGNSQCLVMDLFCGSLLLSAVSQCCAGFALFRIHERAAGLIGDVLVFFRVVGHCWAVLIGSTLGVGVNVWLCGALIVFGGRSEGKILWVGVACFSVSAACCQLVTGGAMFLANTRIRAYFASAEGARIVASISEISSACSTPTAIGLGTVDGDENDCDYGASPDWRSLAC